MTLVSTAAKTATSSGGVTQLDYVERTTALTVTATTEGTAQTFIDSNAITVDGLTRISIELQCLVEVSSAGGTAVAVLLDGVTVLGWLAEIACPGASSGEVATWLNANRYLTPSAGSHTYHVKFFKTAAAVIASGDVGGSSHLFPAFVRITSGS